MYVYGVQPVAVEFPPVRATAPRRPARATPAQYEWELGEGAGGAAQWYPKAGGGAGTVPDAHDAAKSHPPTMFTTDVARHITRQGRPRGTPTAAALWVFVVVACGVVRAHARARDVSALPPTAARRFPTGRRRPARECSAGRQAGGQAGRQAGGQAGRHRLLSRHVI